MLLFICLFKKKIYVFYIFSIYSDKNEFGGNRQFGNMLVLSATYMSPLSQLVDREILRTLLDRTIKFLLQSRHISPSLSKDAEILTLIRRKIFDTPTTSFSSADGHDMA